MLTCPECGKEYSREAKACPHCGKPAPMPTVKAAGVLIMMLGLIGILVACIILAYGLLKH